MLAINPRIKQKAEDIRKKIFGTEVRESLASGIEAISEDVEATIGRQDYVEEQFQDVLDETTGKDVINGPEIIAARNGELNLKTRLDKENQEVTAQLQQNELNTLKAFRERTVSITEFGAMVDGITDDTKAIQDTVDYLFSLGGGTVFIPRGAGQGTRITQSIKWRSGVSLLGVGTSKEHGSGLFHDGELFSAILNIDGNGLGDDGDDPNVWLEDCQFRNFYIDGAKLTHTGQNADGKGIFILYMKRGVFRNVRISNTIGTGFGCDFLVDTVFDNCVAENCGRNWTTGGVGQSGFGIGSGAVEYENVVVSNCTARNCGNYGFFVETQQNTKGIRSKSAKFIGCHGENNRIHFGNKGSGPTQFDTLTMHGGTIGIQLTEDSYGDRINNVVIEKTAQQGILISSSYLGDLQMSNVTIDGCRKNIEVSEVVGSGIILKNWTMRDIIIRNSKFAGIEVGRQVKGLKIMGGSFFDNGASETAGFRQGIFFNKNVENFLISNCQFGNTKTPKTQLIGIGLFGGVKLSTGTFSDLDMSEYSSENGLEIFNAVNTIENVKLSNVLGLLNQQKGTNSFTSAYNYVSVTFPTSFVKAPAEVVVNSKGTNPAWATDITRTGFMARTSIAQSMEFDWVAKL